MYNSAVFSTFNVSVHEMDCLREEKLFLCLVGLVSELCSIDQMVTVQRGSGWM